MQLSEHCFMSLSSQRFELHECAVIRVVKSIDTQKSIDTETLYPDTILIFKSINTVLPPVAPKQSFI